MPTITTKDGTQIYYKDWEKGQPIVFSHGWPLSADDWDAQMLFFGQRGYRVIAHDRRGHGRSTQTWDGNDMDTYADDLAALTEKLFGTGTPQPLFARHLFVTSRLCVPSLTHHAQRAIMRSSAPSQPSTSSRSSDALSMPFVIPTSRP
jgi:hypothetical protein